MLSDDETFLLESLLGIKRPIDYSSIVVIVIDLYIKTTNKVDLFEIIFAKVLIIHLNLSISLFEKLLTNFYTQ